MTILLIFIFIHSNNEIVLHRIIVENVENNENNFDKDIVMVNNCLPV